MSVANHPVKRLPKPVRRPPPPATRHPPASKTIHGLPPRQYRPTNRQEPRVGNLSEHPITNPVFAVIDKNLSVAVTAQDDVCRSSQFSRPLCECAQVLQRQNSVWVCTGMETKSTQRVLFRLRQTSLRPDNGLAGRASRKHMKNYKKHHKADMQEAMQWGLYRMVTRTKRAGI